MNNVSSRLDSGWQGINAGGAAAAASNADRFVATRGRERRVPCGFGMKVLIGCRTNVITFCSSMTIC